MDNKRLNAIATRIAGNRYRSQFTVMQPLMLQKEGATRNSIYNAIAIRDAGYKVSSVDYIYDKSGVVWETNVLFYRSGDNHRVSYTFLGFSIGYSGEGTRGLMEFSDIFGLGFDKDLVFGNKPTPESGALTLRELQGR